MIAIAVPRVETVLERTHHLRVQCTRHCQGESAREIVRLRSGRTDDPVAEIVPNNQPRRVTLEPVNAAVPWLVQRLYAQSQVRHPHAFQNSLRHGHRHRLARARHWRDRWNLFSVPSGAAAVARGSRSVETRELERARPEARLWELRPRGRLRGGLQLCHVPRLAEDPDRLHGHRGARRLRRKPRLRGADVERRGSARVWQLFSCAGAAAGAWATVQFE